MRNMDSLLFLSKDLHLVFFFRVPTELLRPFFFFDPPHLAEYELLHILELPDRLRSPLLDLTYGIRTCFSPRRKSWPGFRGNRQLSSTSLHGPSFVMKPRSPPLSFRPHVDRVVAARSSKALPALSSSEDPSAPPPTKEDMPHLHFLRLLVLLLMGLYILHLLLAHLHLSLTSR